MRIGVLGTGSVGQTIAAALVGKTLNTMSAQIMLNPAIVAGEHDVFVSGNNAGAKSRVTELLRSFGWRNVIDLGDITSARGTEMILPIWLRLYGVLKTPQ